jgi:hypothetical protein
VPAGAEPDARTRPVNVSTTAYVELSVTPWWLTRVNPWWTARYIDPSAFVDPLARGTEEPVPKSKNSPR